MNKYISREEAIKELREVYENEYPTASGDFDEYASHDVPNVLRNMKAAEVQPVNQWISVKDRLPEKDGNYLCYLECGAVCEATFDSTIASEGEEFPFGEWVAVYNSDTLGFTYDAITHWMPLPEPPQD